MKITFSYQPQHLAPPYAYAAVMNIETRKSNGVSIEFTLEYLGRENMSEAELKAEGFTKEDDFKWKGDISAEWTADIESLAQQAFNDDPHIETYLHMEVDGKKLGFPKEIEKTELVFQEQMQAVLEKAEVETPLLVACKFEDGLYEMTWEFAKRLVRINKNESTKWELGRQLLKDIYSIDFETSKAAKKPKINSINPGDGSWYPINDKHVIKTLRAQITRLNS